MDQKNVLAAIALSSAIIVLWSLFMVPDQPTKEQILAEKEKIENAETPKIEKTEIVKEISRDQALEESERIFFENENIKGSISLSGASIDDLTFKNYVKTLNGEDNIVLLNPKKIQNGYYVETGWVTTNKNIEIPNSKTIWKIDGNNKLTPNSPVTLSWTNDDNIKFEKKISIDNQYLFTVNQTIINNSDKNYNFYTYGQIIRNKAPEVTNFYILHEGMLGVFDDQLIEEDYDDIEEKKYSVNAEKGWLGITDKYWITSLIPENEKKFRAEFDYKNKFRANFIETNVTEVGQKNLNQIKLKL